MVLIETDGQKQKKFIMQVYSFTPKLILFQNWLDKDLLSFTNLYMSHVSQWTIDLKQIFYLTAIFLQNFSCPL